MGPGQAVTVVSTGVKAAVLSACGSAAQRFAMTCHGRNCQLPGVVRQPEPGGEHARAQRAGAGRARRWAVIDDPISSCPLPQAASSGVVSSGAVPPGVGEPSS